MSKNKFTHTGIIRGYDARTSDKYRRTMLLRETKNFWVTQFGTKYRKLTGQGTGEWPMFCLDLESIKEIENDVGA
jgi:hypothetical protein